MDILEQLKHPKGRFRVALRAALAVFTATLLARWLHLIQDFWVPMTTATVCVATGAATLRRAIGRVIGTLVGIVLGTLVQQYIHDDQILYLLLILSVSVTYFCVALQPINYSLFVAPLTLTVILLLDIAKLGGVELSTLLEARISHTLLGSGIAVLFSLLILPVSQRALLTEGLERVRSLSLEYYGAIVDRLLQGNQEGLTRLRAQFETMLEDNRKAITDWTWEGLFRPKLRQQMQRQVIATERLGQYLFSLHQQARLEEELPAREEIPLALLQLQQRMEGTIGNEEANQSLAQLHQCCLIMRREPRLTMLYNDLNGLLWAMEQLDALPAAQAVVAEEEKKSSHGVDQSSQHQGSA